MTWVISAAQQLEFLKHVFLFNFGVREGKRLCGSLVCQKGIPNAMPSTFSGKGICDRMLEVTEWLGNSIADAMKDLLRL